MLGLGMNLFKDLDVAYIDQPYFTFLSPKDGSINYEFFEQYQNQLVVINFSSEHWNGADVDTYNKLSQTNINFLLLTYDHELHLQQPRMVYFPWWYHWASVPEQKWKQYSHLALENQIKSNLLGWLGGTPRPNKILSFLKLKTKDYWAQTLWTLNNVPDNDMIARSDDLALTDDELIEWNTIKPSLPPKPQMNWPRKHGDWDINLPHLTDVYLHFVSETTVVPKIFLTEKIWKPLACAVPFVVWGNPLTMSFLKEHGFDIYDDIIDHKYYDSESDSRLRLNKLLEVIDDLVDQGVNNIYNQLQPRALANQTRFFDRKWCQSYTDDLTQAINKYR